MNGNIVKQEEEERIKQARLYKERLAKGERERLIQLEKVNQSRQEERRLNAERISNIEKRAIKQKKLEQEEKLTLLKKREEEHNLKEQKLIEKEKTLLMEKRKFEEQNEERLKGKVKWFNGMKGYGFIERDDKKKDVFVHFSAVKTAGFKKLQEGEYITFEVEDTDRGSTAINLQKLS